MLPGLAMAGGQGGIDLSAGPATSGAEGTADGGSTFYFAPPNSGTTNTVMAAGNLVLPLVVLGVAWLMLKR